MKLLFASDSFKGTLTSWETVELLEKAARQVFGPCRCFGIPVADGGEGTADAVIAATGGERISVKIHGPLMEQLWGYYGKLDGDRAVVEMAVASGLPLIPTPLRDPRKTTTYGTGELLRDALSKGFRDISIAIGGSGTNDGGMGCMRALGARFLDKEGRELPGRGMDLGRVARIDIAGMDQNARQAAFTVMCDVNNPLCGEKGATYTFGKQKGGTPEILGQLEEGMEHYKDVVIREFGMDPDQIPGSGAAGGLGAALLVFLGATLKPGIETVLDLIGFDACLEGVSLVVTGEGRADWQSCFGKVMQGVGLRCKRRGVPVAALVGSMGQGADQILDDGIGSIMTAVNGVMDLEQAMGNARELYYQGALRMFRFIRMGMELE